MCDRLLVRWLQIAVDMNEDKFAQAIALGATDCVSPGAIDVPIQDKLVEMTQWGLDCEWSISSLTTHPEGKRSLAVVYWGVFL